MPRVLKINHIGLATPGAEDALRFFRDGLGLDLLGEDTVATEAVRVLFLPVGESRVELLEPVGNDGPVQRFLASRGPGIHHICLEVDDLTGMMAHLKRHGVRLLDDEPRQGAHHTLVAFIHPKSAGGVLVELVQSEPK
jgi:methylmalonyl-CoA/ethylmalonyl-CoA epimerase